MMGTYLASGGLLVMALLLGASESTQRQLRVVYQNPDFQFTGIAVSKTGRVFVNFPRWSPEYVNAVIEVLPDGSAKAFPDETWNRWDLSPKTAGNHFGCVQSVVVDQSDALWVLDPAAPMLMNVVPGGRSS